MDKPFAITLDVGSSRANHTGAWRTERPLYVHNLPPCNGACPAGENIQQWLYHAEEGGYEPAWQQIMADNPFPAIMGRVCYRPCETACNRAQLDSAVGINSVERFLGDEALRQGWKVPVDTAATGKRVLVVGAGPSGLSAAYHLTRLGHSVTIKDAGAEPGGIPKYRLPREGSGYGPTDEFPAAAPRLTRGSRRRRIPARPAPSVTVDRGTFVLGARAIRQYLVKPATYGNGVRQSEEPDRGQQAER